MSEKSTTPGGDIYKAKSLAYQRAEDWRCQKKYDCATRGRLAGRAKTVQEKKVSINFKKIATASLM